jgi:hypothetical protein
MGRPSLASLVILSLTGPIKIYSQPNLIPNYSFENYSNCPTNAAQVNLAVPWYDPSNASSDYFNSCTSNSAIEVPDNIGGFQYANNGVGYIGFQVYGQGIPNDREYVQVQLDTSLISGRQYYVTFYVAIADKLQFSCDKVGAYFSSGPVTTCASCLMPFVPQIESTSMITDTVGWTQVSGIFTASGGEQYITIGNFRSDVNTNLVTVNNSSIYPAAYFYIDDVSVVNCDSVNSVLNVSDGPALAVYPNPSQGVFQVYCEVGEDGFLGVHNSLGQLVLVKAFNKSDSTSAIDLSAEPNGLYFVSVQTESGTSSKRIIITH